MNIPKEINFKFTSCKLSHKVKIKFVHDQRWKKNACN